MIAVRHYAHSPSRGWKDDTESPTEFHGLMQVWRWANMGGKPPQLDSDHPAFLYALRATQHADRDLVNMLLAEFPPLDFRQLFIGHKDAFYAAYRQWSDAKKRICIEISS